MQSDHNNSRRDRSMSANTLSSCGSVSSIGSLSGSTMSIEERRMKVMRYWEKKK